MIMTRRMILSSLATVGAAAISGSALAMDSSNAAGPAVDDEMLGASTWSKRPLSTGWIVAIDRDAHRVTIDHLPIAHLYMEGGTMIFRVADPDLLYGNTAGDKIRFKVERDGKSYVITWIENSN
jgi:Cu/Ag efflux protein CusF